MALVRASPSGARRLRRAERPTSNVQLPTSKDCPDAAAPALNVERWALDVGRSAPRSRRCDSPSIRALSFQKPPIPQHPQHEILERHAGGSLCVADAALEAEGGELFEEGVDLRVVAAQERV